MKSVCVSDSILTPRTRTRCRRCLHRDAFTNTRVSRSILVHTAKNEVHCYVNEEGNLVCDLLEPGDYIVKHGSSTQDQTSPVTDEVAFCYITESGELISEGLPEGNYTIERANDDQMKEILARMEKITENKTEVMEEEPASAEEEISKESFDPETGVYCYVNADGAMVCEKLDPGDYVVKPMPSGGAQQPLSQERDRDSPTFCYITDDGELICEGMEEGKYKIERATDDDLRHMLAHVEKLSSAENRSEA